MFAEKLVCFTSMLTYLNVNSDTPTVYVDLLPNLCAIMCVSLQMNESCPLFNHSGFLQNES